MRVRIDGSVAVLATVALVVAAGAAAAMGKDYRVVDVPNGGTVRGVVRWSGGMPALAAYPVTKDPEHCGAEPKPNERLVVGPDGGVAHTVVYLEGVTAGKAFALPEARLDQVRCHCEPHVQLARVGSKLTITSSDATLHTVHAYGAAGFNRSFPAAGVSIEEKLRKAGEVRIKCDAGHYWMSGYIHVVEHPYYAVTKGDGSYELAQVPPGTYQIAAWHEGWKELRRETDPESGGVKEIVYADPVVLKDSVTVEAGGTREVSFTLSEP